MKKLQSVFKSNLNEISRGRNKSGEQKMALENIKVKVRYESQQAGIKLFNDYSSIVSEAKYKKPDRKGISSILACITHVAKVSDHSNFKILSPKQIFQRLPITLAQVLNTSENSLNKIRQITCSLY